MMIAAEENAQIVGVGGLQFIDDGRIAIIHTDGVRPTEQKRGIGTALVMARLAAIEASLECAAVTLLATEFSRGFYQRFGFQAVGDPELDPIMGFQICGMELAYSTEIRSKATRWLESSGVRFEQLA